MNSGGMIDSNTLNSHMNINEDMKNIPRNSPHKNTFGPARHHNHPKNDEIEVNSVKYASPCTKFIIFSMGPGSFLLMMSRKSIFNPV